MDEGSGAATLATRNPRPSNVDDGESLSRREVRRTEAVEVQ
jgi:hypothetical protein